MVAMSKGSCIRFLYRSWELGALGPNLRSSSSCSRFWIWGPSFALGDSGLPSRQPLYPATQLSLEPRTRTREQSPGQAEDWAKGPEGASLSPIMHLRVMKQESHSPGERGGCGLSAPDEQVHHGHVHVPFVELPCICALSLLLHALKHVVKHVLPLACYQAVLQRAGKGAG